MLRDVSFRPRAEMGAPPYWYKGMDCIFLQSREIYLTNHCAQTEALFIYEGKQGVR